MALAPRRAPILQIDATERRPHHLIVPQIANPTVTLPRGNRLLQVAWKGVVFGSLSGTCVRWDETTL